MPDWARYVILDQANGGLPAAAFSHPAGWRPDSRVMWNLQQAQMPVQVSAFVASPDNGLAVEFIPMQGFCWPPMPMSGPGQNMAGLIQLQPYPPVEAVTQLVLPNYRGQTQNQRILSAAATPEAVPPNPRAPGAHAQAYRIAVRIGFDHQGQSFEEEFHARQVIMSMPGGWGGQGPTSWQLTDMCCFRAAPGQLDAALPVFERIEKSFEFNPQWQAFLQQTAQNLLGQSARATDAILASGRRQAELNAQASRDFMQRSASYVAGQQSRVDAMANPVHTQTSSTYSPFEASDAPSDYTAQNQRIDSIREEQTVHNPANSANEKISSHYDHVWKDQDGNLQGANDPNFDPNAGADHRQWTRAAVKRPDGS